MAEVTNYFEQRISEYVANEMKNDELFRKHVEQHPEKNVKDACRYVLAQVKESQQCGWDDSEIYGMVKHYYDEADIEVPSDDSNVQRIVVAGHIDLTESERSAARQAAEDRYYRELKDIKRREAEEQERKEKQKAEERRKALEERRKQQPQLMGDLFGGL
jgi:hypothetical protein